MDFDALYANRRLSVALAFAVGVLLLPLLTLVLLPFQRSLPSGFSLVSDISLTPSTPLLPPAEPPKSPVPSVQVTPEPFETPEAVPVIPESVQAPTVTAVAKMVEGAKGEESCDLFQGTWERDEEGRNPLYAPGSCPYVDEAFGCVENGRPDREFMKWRWKPHGCDLPRFNATAFLERLRGKRLMLVGDSMNRNQFESMLCSLREGLQDKSRMYETRGYQISKGRGYFAFKFVDFDCTIEFVRSHFLVKEGKRINGQGNSNPTLMIDHIDKSANRWKKADILIFNTGHWWTHGKTARGKNYYQEGDVIYPKLDVNEAYRKALITWGKWVDDNMNAGKSLIFYRGYSAAHFRGGDWDSGGTCNGETHPIMSGPFLDNYPEKMKIVDEVISQMNFPIILLNVTKLTNFRKDGHPSMYGKKQAQGEKPSKRKQDCSHWCLPGVPDTWNELIYATLVLKQLPPSLR